EGVVDAVYTMPNAPGHAGADPKALAETARAFIPEASAHDSLESALRAAASSGANRILIGGSLYIAGEVLAKNHQIPA
ncbi:MAG: bifunctional folylpolyglutamate synthase/dihydrofolate synthase, partial [Pseudomonadota bacterium]